MRKFITRFVPFFIVAGLTAIEFLNRDNIVIRMGLSGFRVLRVISLIFLTLTFGLAILGVVSLLKQRRNKEDQQARSEMLKEQDAPPTMVSDGGLNDRVIYDYLLTCYNEKWANSKNTELKKDILLVVQQMQEMNGYQDRLASLLQNNGIRALDDSKDTLERVEQYVLQNVRRLVNFMDVLVVGKARDEETLAITVRETLDLNKEQLDKVGEFLIAMTQFINKQGRDTSGTDQLAMYLQTIQSTLQGKERSI